MPAWTPAGPFQRPVDADRVNPSISFAISTMAELARCMLKLCDMQRSEEDELPWVQRDPSEAYRLLLAARQGQSPQLSVERLALLQLLIQLHRDLHERTGTIPATMLLNSSCLQGDSCLC